MTYVRSTRTGRLDVDGDGSRCIMVGAFSQATNIPVSGLGTTKNYPVGIFAKIISDEDTTADVRCLWARLRIDAGVQIGSVANWGSGLKAIQGSLKFYGGTNTGTYGWVNCGVFGSLETDGASKVFFKDGSVSAPIYAHVGLLASTSDYTDIETGAVVAGVAINSGSATNITSDGTYCAIYIYSDAGVEDFDEALNVQDCGLFLKIEDDATVADEDGATGTKGTTTIGAFDGFIKVHIGANDHYILTVLDPAGS